MNGRTLILPKPFRLKPLTPTEHQVQTACLQYLAVCPSVAWAERMNVGAVKIPGAPGQKPRYIRYGFPGCSDILGQMKDGRVLAIEVKSAVGRATAAQDAFLKRVATYGGVSGVVRSTAQLQALIAMSEVQAA